MPCLQSLAYTAVESLPKVDYRSLVMCAAYKTGQVSAKQDVEHLCSWLAMRALQASRGTLVHQHMQHLLYLTPKA